MRNASDRFAPIVLFALLAACGSDTNSGAQGGSGASGKGGSSNGTAGTGGSSAGGSSGVGGSSSGAGGTGGSAVPVGGCGTDGAVAVRSFCDPATWGGKAPTATTDVVVRGDVIVDCKAEARSIEIPPGSTLRASRTKPSTLTLGGNLVVRGRLDYGTPDNRVCGISAEIVFQGMDDSQYEDNPDGCASGIPACKNRNPEAPPVPVAVVDSDWGIWVVDSGVFAAAGEPKKAWSKLTDGAGPADATFTVEDATGWKAGDRLALTPTTTVSAAPNSFYTQFDEGEIAALAEKTITLRSAPIYPHAGCTSCMRRGEAANLSRNVVVRSFDDTAHAHIMMLDKGVIELDSVELRWLGPRTAGGYSRRAPLYFFEQRAGSDPSFVRHTSIWGGEQSFLVAEMSDGIEIVDVAGYDAKEGNAGFMLFHTFHEDSCRFDPGCAAIHYPYLGPRNVRFVDVLAAKVRGDGFSGYLAGPESGCVGCVATGVFDSEDAAGFFQNNNIQVPVAPTALMKDSVAHNNEGNGVRFWQNLERGNLTHQLTPWTNVQVWSNNVGLFLGAYANGYALGDISIEDSAEGTDFAIQAIPTDSGSAGTIRVDGASLGQLNFVAYVVVQNSNQTYRNVHFNQSRKVAVTQNHAPCDNSAEENDPDSDSCFRAFFTLENPTFIAGGAKPFDFGWSTNKHTTWQIRGFTHADYPSLPKNFDLYRKDNQIAGGSYNSSFDAWLVPR